jgi:hypothetical protein
MILYSTKMINNQQAKPIPHFQVSYVESHVEIQQEDPSQNYAPILGWSLRLFLGGSLFLDDEQILFIDGEQILFIDVCRLLLSLNNSWTINISLFSMRTWK